MLVPAVHPSLLALAVVAGAVGALDDARGAVGAAVLVAVEAGLRARRGLGQHQQQQQEGGGGGGRGRGGEGGDRLGHLRWDLR